MQKIRFSFNPDHGGYTCQAPIHLSSKEGGTHLVIRHLYSEDNPAHDTRVRALDGADATGSGVKGNPANPV